jgi:hypothetical protein
MLQHILLFWNDLGIEDNNKMDKINIEIKLCFNNNFEVCKLTY